MWEGGEDAGGTFDKEEGCGAEGWVTGLECSGKCAKAAVEGDPSGGGVLGEDECGGCGRDGWWCGHEWCCARANGKGEEGGGGYGRFGGGWIGGEMWWAFGGEAGK